MNMDKDSMFMVVVGASNEHRSKKEKEKNTKSVRQILGIAYIDRQAPARRD